MVHSRRAVLLLLLLLFWQTVATLSPLTIAVRAAEMDHMAVHAQTAGHHHHDDFSMHADEDDKEGNTHQHADSGLQAPGLTPGSPIALVDLRPSVPASRDEPAGPSPILEGPRRPPRV